MMTTDTPIDLEGPLQYKKDFDKEDILTDKTGKHQVMMEWERSYMDALVQRLNPFGDVLEIGFGLGYSATAIQKYNIKSHTIIEFDSEVLKKLRVWASRQKHQVIIIDGAWQERLPQITKRFDIFFHDDYPSAKYPDPYDIRIFEFYNLIMRNNVKKGSRFTWFCTQPVVWPCPSWTKWDCEEYNIDVPEKVNYINEENKKNLFLPLVTFKDSSPTDMHPQILEQFINDHKSRY